MNRVVRGPNELKIASSILTRRGGTDANAPESTRKAILRDWHFGILAPIFWKILEHVPDLNLTNMNIHFYGTRIGRNERRMHCFG